MAAMSHLQRHATSGTHSANYSNTAFDVFIVIMKTNSSFLLQYKPKKTQVLHNASPRVNRTNHRSPVSSYTIKVSQTWLSHQAPRRLVGAMQRSFLPNLYLVNHHPKSSKTCPSIAARASRSAKPAPKQPGSTSTPPSPPSSSPALAPAPVSHPLSSSPHSLLLLLNTLQRRHSPYPSL